MDFFKDRVTFAEQRAKENEIIMEKMIKEYQKQDEYYRKQEEKQREVEARSHKKPEHYINQQREAEARSHKKPILKR